MDALIYLLYVEMFPPFLSHRQVGAPELPASLIFIRSWGKQGPLQLHLTLRGMCTGKLSGFALRPGATEPVNTGNKDNTVCCVQTDFLLISNIFFLSI